MKSGCKCNFFKSRSIFVSKLILLLILVHFDVLFPKIMGGKFLGPRNPLFSGASFLGLKIRTSHVLSGINDSFHQNIGSKLGFMLGNLVSMGFWVCLFNF